jgi:hypothetical protein
MALVHNSHFTANWPVNPKNNHWQMHIKEKDILNTRLGTASRTGLFMKKD